MKLYKKNDKIYVDYLLGAKRIRKSLKLEWNKTNLNYVRSEIIPKLLKQTGESKRFLLSEALDEIIEQAKTYYKRNTISNQYICYKMIFRYLIDKEISKYTIRDIENFAVTMYRAGMSSGYIRNCLSLLKRGFDIGIKVNVISFNPVFKIQIPKRIRIERYVYSKEEVRLLLDSAQGELQTILYIAVYTGARIGEILALTKEDIKKEYITISKTISANKKFIGSTKNGLVREVYIVPELRGKLQNFKRFTHSYHRVVADFKKLCNRLNLPYTGLHSLRHTYASLLLNDKVNPLVIKQLLGHADMTMLNKVYGHFTGYQEEDINSVKNSLSF